MCRGPAHLAFGLRERHSASPQTSRFKPVYGKPLPFFVKSCPKLKVTLQRTIGSSTTPNCPPEQLCVKEGFHPGKPIHLSESLNENCLFSFSKSVHKSYHTIKSY